MTPRPFNLVSTPLPEGGILIEASAGTGKTFSLSGIILRLILEAGVPINSILVVTYTEAATAEIRDRIRRAVEHLLDVLADREAPNSFEAAILDRLVDVPAARQLLQEQLTAFDPSNISTIHGFCQRMLIENAFESGSLFQCEVLQREEDLLLEVAQDFWRRLVLGQAESEELDRQVAVFKDPATMAGRLKARLRVMEDPRPTLKTVVQGFQKAVELHGEAFKQVMGTKGMLSGQSYSSRIVAELREIMDEITSLCLEDPGLPERVLGHKKRLDWLSSAKINHARKAYDPHPEWELFAATDALLETLHQADWALFTQPWTEFLDWAVPYLRQLKDERNLITFDDMLIRMRDAVQASAPLRSVIRARYQVALVDEFQDTDGIQLEIFNRLFLQSSHRLYCVGDPKQSIYQFRGADLETYLQAREDPRFEVYTLSCNHRSDHAVVEAVNRVFRFKADPFGSRIPFTAVQVPLAKQQPHPPAEPAFIFHSLGTYASEQSTAEATADEVARMAARMGSCSDVAVLVNKHAEARAVADELRRRGIPCIRKLEQSVFATEAAVLLRIALHGMLDCNRPGALKAALATPLFGRSAPMLARLDSDDEALDNEVGRMATWRERWRNSGFMAAFQDILNAEETHRRLMRTAAGEEMLGQLLHLAELLHTQEQSHRCSPESLIEYMAEMANREAGGGSDSSRVRRATDADAVVISTVHSSKGLQYAAVIVPFCWRSQRNDNVAEGMRRLYVALTRARHHCTVILSTDKNSSKTAIAQILGDVPDLIDGAERLARTSAGYIGFRTAIPKSANPPNRPSISPLAARRAPDTIPGALWVASFSALTAAAAHPPGGQDIPRQEQADDPDAALPGVPVSVPPAEDPLPASARTGVALHAIFEKINFADPVGLADRIREETTREGLGDERIQTYLRDRFPRWLQSSLLPGGILPLAAILPGDRLTELEFHFSLAACSPRDLAAALQDEGIAGLPEAVQAANIQTLEGFMKGFIDLVFRQGDCFHILDWKSNRLGGDASGYAARGVESAMLQHLYHLQYLIYTVALDAWLRQRVASYNYNSHFGGVFYVFLRGFDGPDGHGVFHRRPKPSTLQALRACLLKGNR